MTSRWWHGSRGDEVWVVESLNILRLFSERLDTIYCCCALLCLAKQDIQYKNCFLSVGTLAASWWHACYQRTPDDGASRPRWHLDPGFLSHRDALIQYLGGSHGYCRAELHRPGAGFGGGAVPVSSGLPRPVMPGAVRCLLLWYGVDECLLTDMLVCLACFLGLCSRIHSHRWGLVPGPLRAVRL